MWSYACDDLMVKILKMQPNVNFLFFKVYIRDIISSSRRNNYDNKKISIYSIDDSNDSGTRLCACDTIAGNASTHCFTKYRYISLSVIVLLLLVATGLPLLSGGRGGIGVFAGPSAGFLFMYPVITYLIGLVRDLYFNKMNFVVLLGTTIVFGVLLLDIVGTIIMGWITHLPISKSVMLSFVFMPGDLLKAIIASLIGNTMLNHSQFKQLMK